jgi:hypothetical protein
VPNQEELQAQSKDALAKYFSDQIDNQELFRTYETMKTLVGEFKDVPLEKYEKNHFIFLIKSTGIF